MEKLLEVKNLEKHYPIYGGFLNRPVDAIKAVNGLNFHLNKKETLGIVGESGCGKSTTGKTIIRLTNPTHGEIFFKGKNITHIEGEELRMTRRNMQLIFQDPFSSLNPKMTVGDILSESLIIQDRLNKKERLSRVKELLNIVGLSPYQLRRYPHEFSGGQRQRIGIARAISVNPSLIVADEAVSALDVSVQAQIVNLFQDLKEEFDLTYVFISHDLSVVRFISDRIMVMYLGKIMELSDKVDLFENPLHPYTQALLSSIPTASVEKRSQRIILEGDVPDPSRLPTGCFFHPRCRYRTERCIREVPELKDVTAKHAVACHLMDNNTQ